MQLLLSVCNAKHAFATHTFPFCYFLHFIYFWDLKPLTCMCTKIFIRRTRCNINQSGLYFTYACASIHQPTLYPNYPRRTSSPERQTTASSGPTTQKREKARPKMHTTRPKTWCIMNQKNASKDRKRNFLESVMLPNILFTRAKCIMDPFWKLTHLNKEKG